ncbi:M23 family metallopeptidase [Erythrobacter sp. A6_0]|uniref:M23 family metallopeptidase n=1 Tax=Erythrobacter sp. A6_0 TaxID=2821089 RepID=UPI0032AF8FFD
MMKFADRILTVIITATVTSMVWIVAGGSLIENASSDSQLEKTSPAKAAPSPSPDPGPSDPASSEQAGLETPISDQARNAAALNTRVARAPAEGSTSGLLIPVLNVKPSDLSDTFTDSRGGGTRLHEAIDIMAPRGTSVVAAAPGTIERLFRSDAGGNTIYVRSSDGETIHYYAHMDEYAEGLREGQRVRRGQRLGTVGSSGNASPEAPHLHFAILQTTPDAEWWEPANAINPYPILSQR